MPRMKRMKCDCGAKMIPIVYGLPGPKMFKEADKGRIALGGCCISRGAPEWECPECGKHSGSLSF